MIDIEINADNLQSVINELQATQKQIDLALKSTARRMKGWLAKRVLPGMASAVNLQQKILRRRIKYASDKNSIWFGLNSISFKYLKPKKTSTGVSAFGGRHEDNAFINKRGSVLKRTSTERFPVESVETSIYNQAMDYLDSHTIDSSAFEAEFYKVFERELRWRTSR